MILFDLIINWDQTGIKYIPVSEWTMEKEGSRRVEIAGLTDKRQITVAFAGSLTVGVRLMCRHNFKNNR